MKEHPVKVLFRIGRRKGSEVLAIFPAIPHNRSGSECMVYEHNGQHGSCDYIHVRNTTRQATPEEFAPLKKELESIGYVLKVGKVEIPADRDERRRTARSVTQ